VGLDAVLHQARFGTEVLGIVLEDLVDADDELLAALVLDDPGLAVLDQPARRAHPVQRLVGAVIGVDGH
jgi:hypothetical protein